MQRFLVLGTGLLLFLSGIILGSVLLGCGGKVLGPSVAINLTPATISLSRGTTAQITAQALDSANQVVATPALAYDCVIVENGVPTTACSGPNSPITVSSSGLICAGQWDTDFITCQTSNASNNLLPLGTVNISATSASTTANLLRSSTVVVTDHEPIGSMQLIPGPQNPVSGSACNPTGCYTEGSPNACTPNVGTFTAKAFSNDPTACQRITGSPTVPCEVPSNTIGSVNWSVTPGQVATLSETTTLASDPTGVTVTSSTPGQGAVVGSVGSVGSTVSGSLPFATCPVAAIQLQTSTGGTSFTAPVSATVNLTATVTDIQGIQLDLTTNSLGLAWLTSQPALANVALGTVNTASPGTAEITAACLPPGCNINFTPPAPVYSSNPITATITGTVDSTVLVTTATPPACVSTTACTNFNYIVPIDSQTHVAGSPFTLPDGVQVNSMVISPTGDPAFLGTICADGTTGVNGAACSGLMRFDPASGNSTVPAPSSTIPGAALLTDGNRVVVSNPSQNQLIIATSTPGIEAIPQINISSLIGGNGATETGNTVTITTTSPHNFSAGQTVVVNGVGVAGYNGTFTVQTVPSPSVFTYNDAANSGLAPSGGGYASAGVASAISPDGSTIYIVAGRNLYIYKSGLPLQTRSLSGLMNPNSIQAVSFLGNGSMAYTADSGGDDVIASCNNMLFSTVPVSGFPSHIAGMPNATAMVDANSPNIDEIDVTANPADLTPYGVCPPDITNSHITTSFGTTFTPTQLIVTPDSTQALILSDKGVLDYNLTTKLASVVQLAGTGVQALSGGVTPDSASLYVGTTDGTVHLVDLTKTPPVDAGGIPVVLCPSVTSCNPDFVVVRPVATVATLKSLTITPNPPPTIGTAATVQFKAEGTFSDNTSRDMTSFVTWSSSNTIVAVIGPETTVSPPITTPGLARGLAVGTATISASSAGVSASVTLTVN